MTASLDLLLFKKYVAQRFACFRSAEGNLAKRHKHAVICCCGLETIHIYPTYLSLFSTSLASSLERLKTHGRNNFRLIHGTDFSIFSSRVMQC